MVTFALCIMIGLAWECNFHGPAIGLFALAVLDRLDRIAEQIKYKGHARDEIEEAVVKDWEAQLLIPARMVSSSRRSQCPKPSTQRIGQWSSGDLRKDTALGQSMALAKDKETADLIVDRRQRLPRFDRVDQRQGSSARKQEANHTLPLTDLHLR